MAISFADHASELANKLARARSDLDHSASYYDASYRLKALGIGTPPEMRQLTAAVGWPRMYLDSIEERLDIEAFRRAGSSQQINRLWDWWQANDMDEESGLGHLDALIYGRSYVTVAAPDTDDDPDTPVIRVESPLSMITDTDPRTRRVTRALRLYSTPNKPEEARATLYLPNETVPLIRNSGTRGRWRVADRVIRHKLGHVPVVPLVNRERLAHRHGRSEITAEIRSITDAASRTMMNMQATAELMAVPQRVMFGVDAESIAGTGSQREILDAYLARIIAIENEAASATQFAAAELRNFTEVLDQLAKHIASYTGLPPQYLSFASDNPASAEAIRSAESRLVKKCERKARMFGGSWERVMRLTLLVMDRQVPEEFRRLETVWRDPSTPTYAAKADAVVKLYNSGNGIIPLERARIDMGYSTEERAEMARQDESDPIRRLSALVGDPAVPVTAVGDAA